MALESLGKALNVALGRLEGSAGVEARAVMLWPEIAGEELARRAEARSVRAGVLVVAVSSSVWSQEIAFQKRLILRRYKDKLGADVVKDVRTISGAMTAATSAARPSAAPPRGEVAAIVLSDDERERIERVVGSMSPDLADPLRRTLIREAQHRVWNLTHGARECPGCGAAHRSATDRCPACRVRLNSG